MRKNEFETWEDVRKELFSQEEIAESDLRVVLLCRLDCHE